MAKLVPKLVFVQEELGCNLFQFNVELQYGIETYKNDCNF
jgi:hypothetical protein